MAANRSPVPASRLIRVVFQRGGAALAVGMAAHVPDGVDTRIGVPYRIGDQDALLDVFRPAGVREPLPLVVWVHGGAWVAGDKYDVAPYLAILAGTGRCVGVGLNYTRGPAGVHPLAIRQINDAFEFLTDQADRFGIDPTRIVLAGDSAGAQLASQFAAMVTEPTFAAEVGIAPVVSCGRLRGVLLHCGVYDLTRLGELTGLLGWAYDKIVWAYTGRRGLADNVAAAQMSTINTVTAAFPPTLITGGNGDALTATQSRPMADRLAALSVPVRTHFYPADRNPALGHEFQFDLDSEAGQEVLRSTLEFLVERFDG